MSLHHSALPRAPFAPGGPFEIDHERARKLLTVALSQGGDAADLFAEYGLGASMVLEEGIVKSASRGVGELAEGQGGGCLLYTSPSPRD